MCVCVYIYIYIYIRIHCVQNRHISLLNKMSWPLQALFYIKKMSFYFVAFLFGNIKFYVNINTYIGFYF